MSDEKKRKEKEETVTYQNNQGTYAEAPARPTWFNEVTESFLPTHDRAQINIARKYVKPKR